MRAATLLTSPFFVCCADKFSDAQQYKAPRTLSKTAIPYFLATSDVLFGLASGMTIKFFPIFFLRQVELSPIGTNFIMAGTPLCIATMSFLAPQISRLVGETCTKFDARWLTKLPCLHSERMFQAQLRLSRIISTDPTFNTSLIHRQAHDGS